MAVRQCDLSATLCPSSVFRCEVNPSECLVGTIVLPLITVLSLYSDIGKLHLSASSRVTKEP